MQVWILATWLLFLPGWFLIGLVAGQGCIDKAPWCERAQAVWLVISATITAIIR